jgi:ABC-2 type transport system permease protein
VASTGADMNETLSVARGVSWRVLHMFFTNPAFLLPSLAFPLFFFTAFVGGLSRVSEVPGFDFPSGYTAFQFVFVLLQSAAFAGVFTGFGIARDFESGFMRRLMLAAPNRSGILLGYLISAFVRWFTVALVVTVVALLAQMNIGGSGIDLFGLYGLALLLNLAGTLWATGVAMRLRTQQAAPIMQMPVFLLLFFAPVYVPLSLLQGWIHAVASVNPITALLEAGRGFITGEPELRLAAYSIAFGLILGFAVWAVRGLRSAERAG